MGMLALIHTMTAYNESLHRKVWESVFTLTDAQFIEDVGYSHGSLRNQMVHLAVVEERWLRGLKGDPGARGYNPAPTDFATRQAAFDLWETAARNWQDYLQDLREADLEAQAPGMEEPTWQIILHVVNHGTDHRAQALRMLADLGAPTFSQDLIFYLWSAGKGA